MKKYLVGLKVYSFEVLETHKTCNGQIIYWAKCLRNDKFAWLDEENGIQFEGEERFVAEPYTEHGYGAYTLWGGELRPRYNWQKTPVKSRW